MQLLISAVRKPQISPCFLLDTLLRRGIPRWEVSVQVKVLLTQTGILLHVGKSYHCFIPIIFLDDKSLQIPSLLKHKLKFFHCALFTGGYL